MQLNLLQESALVAAKLQQLGFFFTVRNKHLQLFMSTISLCDECEDLRLKAAAVVSQLLFIT